ncbi:MAG: acyltransferase [Marmoricola sp.]|nr:acyltransferase [Marmoricola sp.]
MTAGTGRYDYLDGLRALAIGAVLSLHWLAWYVPFFHGGSIGVDVFFVLSGFIITTVLWHAGGQVTLLGGWWSFIRRRVLRLYPALLGLVVGTVLLYAVAPFAPLGAGEVARRGLLALGQTSAIRAAGESGSLWLPGLHPFAQTWSLAVEWYFYLVWPLVVIAFRRRGSGARRLAVGSLVAAAALYLASLPLSAFWFYFGPSARFAELFVGGALALWFQADGAPTLRPVRTPLTVAALAALGAYALLGPGGASPLYRWVGIPVAVGATVVLICAGYGAAAGPVQRLLGHPWLTAVGRYSYSLYLWHVVPMLLLEDAWPALPQPVVGLVAVALTIVLTIVSYRLLERPFLRPRSDVLSPAQRARAVAPSL